jgi:hypothetical protein
MSAMTPCAVQGEATVSKDVARYMLAGLKAANKNDYVALFRQLMDTMIRDTMTGSDLSESSEEAKAINRARDAYIQSRVVTHLF